MRIFAFKAMFSFITVFNILFGQLDYSLSIEKIHYGLGEDVPITVTVTSSHDLNITLSWSDHCQATYSVDSEQYNFHCIQIPSEINLAPDSSYSWEFIYEGTDSISSGVHFIQGEVFNYGFTDSLFIHISDVDTAEVLSYLPMEVGNRWQFLTTQGQAGVQDDTSFITISIDTMVTIDGLNYYHFDPFFMSDISSFLDPMFSYIRIDTSRLVVNAIGWDICDEVDIVYLYMDETINFDLYYHYSMYEPECMPIIIWRDPSYYLSQMDTSLQSISILYPLSSGITLVENLGIGYINRFEHWNNAGYMYLIAAEINGVVYGEFLGIEDEIIIPNQFSLAHPYPNPFNPITNIQFTLNKNVIVLVTIFDVLGRKVKQLVKGELVKGKHEIKWNGTNDLSQPVSAGVYFYRVEAGEFVQTRKMVLLK